MPSRARLKSILFHAILVLIPLSVAAAAVAWYGCRATAPYLDFVVKYYGDNDIVFDREIGFVRPAHATTRRVQPGIDYTIHTDAIGARVDGPGRETPKHVDILTVGCSFSEGHGFPNEQTYTERLGKMLSVPVANFAIGSYSGVQSELSLERHASLAPRVIVYGLIEDHLRRNLDPCAPNFFPNCLRVPIAAGLEDGNPHFTTVGGSGFAGVELTADLLKLPEDPSILNRSVLGLRTAYHEFRDWRERGIIDAEADITQARQIASEQYVLRRMAQQARRMHATLVVLYMSRVDGLPADDLSKGWFPLPRAVIDAIPKDVVFIDTAPRVAQYYAQHPGQHLYLTRTDDHPNAVAHGLFAELLREQIVARGLLARAAIGASTAGTR